MDNTLVLRARNDVYLVNYGYLPPRWVDSLLGGMGARESSVSYKPANCSVYGY